MDEDDIPRHQRLHSDVLNRLDGSGGTVGQLFNALHAADEAGFYVESDEDRATDIDALLDQAMEAVEEEDPDSEKVLRNIIGATDAASEFIKGLDKDVKEFELPDHVDTGVYDTLGDYADYVYRDLLSLRERAVMWDESTD